MKARSLDTLRSAAAQCTRCDLYKDAAQTVFGEGTSRAKVVLVGEQPGDSEDETGRPFVGPAGKLLRKALADAGFAERDVYLTNAVKHFKFVLRGKRRIHTKPKRTEIRACEPWLEEELRAIEPDIVVALGATAASVVFGTGFRLTEQRGQILDSPLAGRAMATFHPSAILRAPDDAARHDLLRAFTEDLRLARELAGATLRR